MFLWVLSTATIVFGQTATTSLRGVITDPTGALVPGAKVTLVDNATGVKLEATANSSGYYLFPQIPPAKFTITVTASGFGSQIKTAELLVSQPATIDFALTVKAITETVDVSATVQTLNMTDATVGNSVNNSTIQALPMDGRDPVALLSLQPGVLYIGAGSDSRQGVVAGARSDQGNITLDGVDDNYQVVNTGFAYVLRSTMDSTEEFRVTTSNGTAEAGRSSGAQVNLVTKSGTNKFHGALYEYNRPTNTVANDWFLKESELSSGLPNKPNPYHQNVFGGSVGGPIKKDKLFFFFNYEGYRVAISSTVNALVPTAPFYNTGSTDNVLGYVNDSGGTTWLTVAQVAQLDQGCTQCTAPGANPLIQKYMSTEPTIQPGQGLSQGDGINSGAFVFSSPMPSTQNTSILKLDYNLNSHNHIYGRGNLQKDTSSGAEQFPGQGPSQEYEDNAKGLAVGYTFTPTSKIVNDLHYGYVRDGNSTAGPGEFQGDFVTVRFYSQPTSQTRAYTSGVPVNNIIDNLNWIKGNHAISLGGNWRGIMNNYAGNANSFSGASTDPYWMGGNAPDPTTLGLPAVGSGFLNSYLIAYSTLVGTVPQFNGQYNYAISSPTAATLLADGTPYARHFRTNEFEYYAQDSWHLRPNLMLIFGLRHTILQTPYETKGQQLGPTIDMDAWYKKRGEEAAQGIVYEPSFGFTPNGKVNHAPAFWPKQKLNIAPRLSVVWSPNATTSVRAGAGMYFDHYGESLVQSWDQTGGAFGLSATLQNPASVYTTETAPRFTGPHDLPNIDVGSPPSSLTYPAYPEAGAFSIAWGIDNKIKTPYSENFDLSIQKQLRGGFLFETAYVGHLGRHLIQDLDLAEPVNYKDPKGGGDYFTAGSKLSKLVDQNLGNPNASVPTIQYFEDVFPGFANLDYTGQSATQAIYTHEWAPYRYTAAETQALADLDFYCPSIYGSSCNPQPLFWHSQFSSLYSPASIGTSSYNALQFTLRRPQSHGFTMDLSYTFSKSIDLGSLNRAAAISQDYGFGQLSLIRNTWNPKLNRAVSDFDTRSLFTSDWVYALPVGRGKAVLGGSGRILDAIAGGWQWAGLGRWTSGLPFTVNEPGWTTDWEDPSAGVVTGPVKLQKHISEGSPQVFAGDTASIINNGIRSGTPIRLPYPGEAGQRNHFRGDGYFGIDSSLTKTWSLAERAKLKFAWEVYNVSNTPRFDVFSVGNQLTSGNLGYYGRELTTYRRMQFGLRLEF
jgi:hypothetical protein